MQYEFWAQQDQDQWVYEAMTAKNKIEDWKKWKKCYNSPSILIDRFTLLPDISAITGMPALSFMLRFSFRLHKPFLSKDERDFYLLENPLRREKVFQVPMFPSTGWKGSLRAALWQLGHKKDDEVTIRLFGNARDSDEGQAGRLYFYPTFFNRINPEAIDLEVLNPHSRKTGTGAHGPILLECVPPGTPGDFVLLYMPFSLPGRNEADKCQQVAEDLETAAGGIRAMLLTYGFGAKTSSGFGTVEEQLNEPGTLAIQAEWPNAGGKTPANLQSPMSKPDLPGYTAYSFGTLGELYSMAQGVADRLRAGGAA